MQHITLKEVKEACRTAYDRKLLIAQHGGEYGYRVEGHFCAIGSALTTETLDEIEARDLQGRVIYEAQNPVSSLPFTWSAAEFNALTEIQKAHDLWLHAFVIYEEDRSQEEQQFLKLIGHSQQ